MCNKLYGHIGLSFEDRQDAMACDSLDDQDFAMHTLPPGEEGMFLSHEGGEDELCKAIFNESPQPQYVTE